MKEMSTRPFKRVARCVEGGQHLSQRLFRCIQAAQVEVQAAASPRASPDGPSSYRVAQPAPDRRLDVERQAAVASPDERDEPFVGSRVTAVVVPEVVEQGAVLHFDPQHETAGRGDSEGDERPPVPDQ